MVDRYIIECVTPEITQEPSDKKGKVLLRGRYARRMVGVFDDYNEADRWKELHLTNYPTMLIHTLSDPYDEGVN